LIVVYVHAAKYNFGCTGVERTVIGMKILTIGCVLAIVGAMLGLLGCGRVVVLPVLIAALVLMLIVYIYRGAVEERQVEETIEIPVTFDNLLAMEPGDAIVDAGGLPWVVLKNMGVIEGSERRVWLQVRPPDMVLCIATDPEQEPYPVDAIRHDTLLLQTDISRPETVIRKVVRS
jgi:hypothetical protein